MAWSQSRCKDMLHNFYVWTLILLNPNPKSLSGNMVYQNRYSWRLIYLWPRLWYLFNKLSILPISEKNVCYVCFNGSINARYDMLCISTSLFLLFAQMYSTSFAVVRWWAAHLELLFGFVNNKMHIPAVYCRLLWRSFLRSPPQLSGNIIFINSQCCCWSRKEVEKS